MNFSECDSLQNTTNTHPQSSWNSLLAQRCFHCYYLILNLLSSQMFSGQTSKGTRFVNMQLFIFICLAYFYLGDTCPQVPVEKLDEGMLYRNRQLDQLK